MTLNYKNDGQSEELQLVYMTDEIDKRSNIQEEDGEAGITSTHGQPPRYALWQLFVVELLGTFLLVIFGNASVACSFFSKGNRNDVFQLYWSIGYGLGLFFALLPCASISGGHLNPAVTISMLSLRKVNVLEALVYIAGQFVGAFISAAILFGLYFQQIDSWEAARSLPEAPSNYSLATAGIFTTMPGPHVGFVTCFFDQVVGTAFLLFGILCITDDENPQIPQSAQPAAIATVLGLILMSFGSNCGGALNPARDLSPRVFTAIAGWGSSVFSVWSYCYFWIPIVGPIVGGLVGAWTYQLIILIKRSGHLKKIPSRDGTKSEK